MCRFHRIAASVFLFGCTLAAQIPDTLELRILEGSGAVVPRNGPSSRRFTVVVADSTGGPVAGATVTFRLPNEGPSGQFASGLLSEAVVTGPDGRASVYGIRWNDVPGSLEMRVTASSGGRRAEAEIRVEISSAVAAERVRGAPSSKKWWIIGGAAAGALVSLAAIRPAQTPAAAAYTIPAPAKIPPSIGLPVISVGRP